jgi:hypothetical protein
MALLAETLVDEWLNRQGFFTVRGIKHGNDEIDLLGVRPDEAELEAWHVEVQASFRPVGYISPVTDEIAKTFPATPKSAKSRPPEVVKECAAAWVDSKFRKPKKESAREQAWPGRKWEYVFVHAVVRDQEELKAIAACGVRLVSFHEVLKGLAHEASKGIRGGAGTDFSEIIEYFQKHTATDREKA